MALELKDITKSFGGVRAVDSVSMGFESGEVTALLGPNGAGKTTLFHVIGGQLEPDAGSVRHRGQSLTGLAPYEVAQCGIGRLFQDVRLFERMTVLDNVRCAFPDQHGESAWRSVLTRWRVNSQERSCTKRAMKLLEQVGLAEKADELGENLSYGQQKLVAIARLLAMGGEAFLLDEPVAGVDPGLIDSILETIRQLAQEGKTVVVIEHNMNAVLDIADRAYFMVDGQCLADGSPETVLNKPDVRAAYMGLEEMSQSSNETASVI